MKEQMVAAARAARRRTPPTIKAIGMIPRPKIIPSSVSGSVTGSVVGSVGVGSTTGVSGVTGSGISIWAS